jgi:hypothetical protein
VGVCGAACSRTLESEAIHEPPCATFRWESAMLTAGEFCNREVVIATPNERVVALARACATTTWAAS